MQEPIRAGNRGGHGDFKWSDVSADKDRENYLGHSINAPTGRWQKNKDVHWYNRDLNDTAAERAEEIRRIKELEADALSVALGFEPEKRNGIATSSNSVALGANVKTVAVKDESEKEKEENRKREKEESRKRKAERKAEKLVRKEMKEMRRLERRSRRDDRSRSPRPRRSRSRSPRRPPSPGRLSRLPRPRSRSPPRRGRTRSRSISRSRSASPARYRRRRRSSSSEDQV
ncbi:kinase phosphorylation protein-domain-containing protein [Mycena floridula]|nr:kinase phosphorylation protein-domain-containing protein [Mycena floridula]